MKSGSGCLATRRLTATAHKAAVRPSHSERGCQSAEKWSFPQLKNRATRNYEWRMEIHQLLVQLNSKHLDIRWLESVVWEYFSFKYTHSQEGLSGYKELREEDVLGSFLTADWQLPYEQGSICQHSIWRTAEPLGDGPHGPGMTKLRGCSQPSLGAWPFRVIDRRSKRHFLRGDLWRRWHGRASLRAYGVKTIPYFCLLRSHQCRFNYLPQ